MSRLWTSREIRKLRYYASRGFSQSEAGAVLGRSKNSIASIAARFGIKFSGKPGAPKGCYIDSPTKFSDLRQPSR